jgi:hypothetical protein
MLMPSIDTTQAANAAANKADEILETVGPSPFSVPAYAVLRGKVGQYIGDLFRESEMIAKQQQADIISAKHVEAASDRLTWSPERRLYRNLGRFGGLLIGFSVSTLGSMLVESKYPVWAIVLTVITIALGAFLLGQDAMRDR